MSKQNSREQTIVRTSMVGIITNLLLVAFKALVGLASNSIAIILDAVNNLTDAMSSIITILGAKLANRRPDKDHPLGHGRYEYLSAMAISALVIWAGITALIESVKKIITPEEVNYTTETLIVVGAAVIVKLILGTYVSKKGKQVNSNSLIASGKDAIFDALISISVLAAAFIYIFAHVSLEAYVGIIISIVIIKAGVDMIKETLDDILGHRPSSDLSKGIKETINKNPDVLGAYDLLLESYGPDLTIGAVHIEVVDTMTAAEIDVLTRHLQSEVYKEHGISLATVGIYSKNTTDESINEMEKTIQEHLKTREGVRQMHEFYVNVEEKIISFDLVIDFEVKNREELFEQVIAEIKKLYPEFKCTITLDRDLSD